MDSTKQSLSIPMDCTENEKENFESEVKLQIKEKTVKFGEKPYTFVYVKDVDQSIWFVGNCIAEMLGYTNRPKAISQNVSTTNVKQFCELEPLELKMAHSIQKMSKFINETGLFEFITKSKMPNTTEFKNWITDDVLPQCGVVDKLDETKQSIETGLLEFITKSTMPNETVEHMNIDTNKLQIKDFQFGLETVSFRFINTTDGIWFVAKDMAITLQYTNSVKAIQDHVSDCNLQTLEGLTNRYAGYDSSLLLQNHTKLINEAGLYQLIMKSKMPKAIEFQTWVTSDVLPSLRKTGKYSMEQASMKDAENMNIINKVIDGADAQWMEEKMKLLEKNNELMITIQEKDQQINTKNQQLIQQFGLVQEKDKQLIKSLYENGELKTKMLVWQPLVATKPNRPGVFHLLELFSIKADDTIYQYGYFCSRIQERSAPNARPKPHETPNEIFSIKCANSINAYNCLKEHIRSTLNKYEYLIIGKRFYCNIPPFYIKLQFNEILSVNH